jgi:hypothetical protein
MTDQTPTPRRKSPRQLDAERAQRAEQMRMEDDVLDATRRLDPADDSLRARQLRETAASITDHRETALLMVERAVRDAEPTTARLLSDEPWQYFRNGQWATRRLRMWRTGSGVLTAMLTEFEHDEGPSITNSIEAIAAKLAMEFPGEHLVFVEHYPANAALQVREHFDLVTHLDSARGIVRWAEMDPADVLAQFGDLYETVPRRAEPDPYDGEQE